MPKLQIRHHSTGNVLYEGKFTSAKECVERAVEENACLDYADLRYTNLSNANIDDIAIRHAKLDYANLTGINLSEAQIDSVSFTNATLYAACLCYSSLINCNFDNAFFGGTDIAGCHLEKIRFAATSAFTLNFAETACIQNCLYKSTGGTPCPLSSPPIVIQGTRYPIIFMDRHLKIGNSVKTYEEWDQHIKGNISSLSSYEQTGLSIYKQNRTWLKSIHYTHYFQKPRKNYVKNIA